MAITSADCAVWRELRRRDLIPDRPNVLEIGRANWYGDEPLESLLRDVAEFGDGQTEGDSLSDPWVLADLYYRAMLRNPKRIAVDIDANACDIRHDLNRPFPVSAVERYFLPADIIINTGTTEHIFDQRQVWESIHDCCKAGGLMVHTMPLWGWLDHGFYNYQPTFVTDIAAANGYEIVLWMFAELLPAFQMIVESAEDIYALAGRANPNALMQVVYRRTSEEVFRVPMQGAYRQAAFH